MNKKKGVVLSLANQKGGVGKSVSATNLAVSFARRGKRTLLIDADYQGNASMQIGIKRQALSRQKTISAGLIEGIPISKLWLKTKFTNLFAVAADMEFCEFNSRHTGKADAQLLFKEWVEEAKSFFDIIVVDTHPSLDLIFQNVMIASDFYVLPLFAEVESLEGLHIMFNHVRVIQKKLNTNLQILGCLVTKYSGKSTHKRFLSKITEFGKKFKMPVIGVIPMTSAMASASENQLPVVTKNLAVSKAYEKLADYLVDKLKPRGKGRVPETPAVTKQNLDLLIGLVEEEHLSVGTLEEEMKLDGF